MKSFTSVKKFTNLKLHLDNFGQYPLQPLRVRVERLFLQYILQHGGNDSPSDDLFGSGQPIDRGVDPAAVTQPL